MHVIATRTAEAPLLRGVYWHRRASRSGFGELRDSARQLGGDPIESAGNESDHGPRKTPTRCRIDCQCDVGLIAVRGETESRRVLPDAAQSRFEQLELDAALVSNDSLAKPHLHAWDQFDSSLLSDMLSM